MEVLIAGGAGYIGSTVASACLDAGIRPVIVDSLVTGTREFAERHAFYRGDIADRWLIDRVFAAHPGITAAIHCAGLISVPDSAADPVRYYRANVVKSLEFATHLLRNDCGRLIFSSSAAVYRRGDGAGANEDSAIGPVSPYGRTKAACEAMLADIAAATPLRVLSLRYFNPVGADPKMRSGPPSAAGVLGAMIAAREQDVPFTITGTDWPTRDGTGVRDYVHVWDVAAAHVTALARMDALPPGTAVNLGSGAGTTVRELLDAFGQVTGRPLPAVSAPRRPGDTAGGYARTGRAQILLDWRPAYSLADGIAHSLQWAGTRRAQEAAL
jgi:UDP-glucose 4-epimerase